MTETAYPLASAVREGYAKSEELGKCREQQRIFNGLIRLLNRRSEEHVRDGILLALDVVMEREP